MNRRLKKDIDKAAEVHKSSKLQAGINNFNFPSTTYNSGEVSRPIIISDPSDGAIISDPIPIPTGTTMSGIDVLEGRQDVINQVQDSDFFKNRYDFLISTSLDQLKASGYSVDSDGSVIFDSKPFMPLMEIQAIENANGTAGALLLHLQEPEIAKNTAGYGAGNSGTFTGTEPPHDTVIPEVEVLPPVEQAPDGTVQFTDSPVGNLPGATDSTTPLQSGMGAILPGGSKYWWAWYVGAVAIIIIYIKFIRK